LVEEGQLSQVLRCALGRAHQAKLTAVIEAKTMNTTNLEKNKLDPEGGDDIPFIILCSPTKNEAHQAQEDNTAAEEKDDEDLPHLMSFFLKPRRSCHTGSHHQKDVEPIADMLCEFSLNNNIMGKELADESMDLDCSSWSSPLRPYSP